MAVIDLREDPGLYVHGLWPRLHESQRLLIAETTAPSQSTEAWRAILEQEDCQIVALALDLAVSDHALLRWSAETSVATDQIRRAAFSLLDAPAIETTGRFGQRLIDGSHVVALRALGFSAQPDDALALSRIAVSAVSSVEMKRAWIAASAEALRTADRPTTALVRALLSFAEDEREDELIAAEAIAAIGTELDPDSELRLHAILAAALGDRRVEAACLLGAGGALTETERELIRAWLQRPNPEGLLAQRVDELRMITTGKGISL